MNFYQYQLNNLNDTKKLATIISQLASANLILLLTGTLGSGKTQLVKFIGQMLGITNIINSPTFVIWNQYQTQNTWNLIHMDAYRLNNDDNNAEYFEIMANNFMIIEWPEKLTINFANYSYIAINLKIINDNIRKITVNTNKLEPKSEKVLIKVLNSLTKTKE